MAPQLGPGIAQGRGSVTPTHAGLAWRMTRRLRTISGTIPWSSITRWETGLQILGRDSAAVALISHTAVDRGFIGLQMQATAMNLAALGQLADVAAPLLPAGALLRRDI